MRKRTPAKKTFIYLGIIIILLGGGIYVFQHYKSWIVRYHLQSRLTTLTDNLYTLSYDDLVADTANGNIYINNIRIVADTGQISNIPTEKLPAVMLDATVRELTVKKAKVLDNSGKTNISGDTILIQHPEITMYILKPLQRNTQLETEARKVYREILKKLSSVKIGYLVMDSIYVRAVNYRAQTKSFDFLNGNIELRDVLIDRTGDEDTLRTLFTRNASFTLDSVLTYQNDWPEVIVRDVRFDGYAHNIVFKKIVINRYDETTQQPGVLLEASNLWLRGMNTAAVVRHKDLAVDSIGCGEIKIYEPPGDDFSALWSANTDKSEPRDTTSGFQNAYSVHLKSLLLNNIQVIPSDKGRVEMGKVKFQLHNIAAARLYGLRTHPSRYTEDARLEISYLKMMSGDHQYQFGLHDIFVNSAQRSMSIAGLSLIPVLSESGFAAHHPFQKDRYEVAMNNIEMDGIEMDDIFRRALIANNLNVANTMVRIFRDMNRPVDTVSKMGNYPSQLLEKLGIPISIRSAQFPLMSVEYREKRKKNGAIGTIRLENTDLHIANVTNIPSEISKNNVLSVSFTSDIQGSIALKGTLAFSLGSKKGDFRMNGTIGSYNAPSLNHISVPMAMIRVNSGHVDGIRFDFSGDDFGAGGNMVMKYRNLKIDVLKKRDKYSDTLKKRGLLTLIANMAITDENPKDGNLREVNVRYERNPRKSFFNLIWKTLFTGMMETLGIS